MITLPGSRQPEGPKVSESFLQMAAASLLRPDLRQVPERPKEPK